MLIEFSCKNWMSFRDEIHFSMIASDEKSHLDRLSRLSGFDFRILPVSAIFGGNAAGKTSFFQALNFAKQYITSGTASDRNIPVMPFQLDKKTSSAPTQFKFTIFTRKRMFKYNFEVDTHSVISEKLIEIERGGEERTHYARSRRKISFHKSLPQITRRNLRSLAFVTSVDQLFLTGAYQFERRSCRPVFDWFKHNLELIAPDLSDLRGMLSKSVVGATSVQPISPRLVNATLPRNVSKLVSVLDTGISKVEFEEVTADDPEWPKSYTKYIEANLKSNESYVLFPSAHGVQGRNFHIVKRGGELVCYKWVPYHKTLNGAEIKFEFSQESAGTRRLIELLTILFPIFSSKAKKVYVIDEIDRSLHTNLSAELIEAFLLECTSANQSQMIFTTHDSALMSDYLFRRDELWLMERGDDGSSHMLSIDDIDEQDEDKKEDVRVRYLSGRYGGIPQLLLGRQDFQGEGE